MPAPAGGPQLGRGHGAHVDPGNNPDALRPLACFGARTVDAVPHRHAARY
jgi:hypothetical protein